MPIEVFKDAFVSINAVDLSDHVEAVTVEAPVEILDALRMGDVGSFRLAGIEDASVALTFFQDFDAAKVDATLWPLRGVETAIKVRKSKAGAISATNPEFQMNGMTGDYKPIDGSVGQVHKTSPTFVNSDGVAMLRDVTP